MGDRLHDQRKFDWLMGWGSGMSDHLEMGMRIMTRAVCWIAFVAFLLGVDAQTTGGYPRIAQIIRADRPSIGQLRPGSRVRFIEVTPARAHELLRRKLLLWRSLMPQLTL